MVKISQMYYNINFLFYKLNHYPYIIFSNKIKIVFLNNLCILYMAHILIDFYNKYKNYYLEYSDFKTYKIYNKICDLYNNYYETLK